MSKVDELIKILKAYVVADWDWMDESESEQGAIEYAEKIIKLFEERNKSVVIPVEVAEWLEKCKKYASLSECIEGFYTISVEERNVHTYDSVADWLAEDDNDLLLARAWLDGYEVEQEQLYRVIFAKGKGDWKYTFLDEDGLWDNTDYKPFIPMFTESEIKAIDERYWAFAVPVKGETE